MKKITGRLNVDNLIAFIQKLWVSIFVLALILVGAFAVRLWKIDNPVLDWHSWRQADTASVSKVFLEDGIDLLHPRYHDVSKIQTGTLNPEGLRMLEFPVFNAAHVVFFKTIGAFSFEAWGRMVSVISAVVTTALIFLIGRRTISPLGGILSAFFYAFVPYNVYFTRVILPEPMATMFGVLSLWLFIKYVDDKKPVMVYLSAVSFAVASLIKPTTLFYIVPLAYLSYKTFGFWGSVKNKHLALAADLALVPVFAWRIWVNQFPRGIAHFLWAFNGDGIRFRPAFWRWIFGERLGRLILGTWGLVPLSFGILVSKGKLPYLMHWMLLGMFLYISIFATANVRHDYYQTIVMPALALTLGAGSAWMLTQKMFNRFVSYTLLGLSVFLMLGFGFFEVRGFYQVNNFEYKIAGETVDKLTEKDSLVIAPQNGSTAFLYQTNRWGWPVVDDDINTMIELGADYYVSINKEDRDTSLLKTQFETLEEGDQYIILDLGKPI